jgi:hypothetical protein
VGTGCSYTSKASKQVYLLQLYHHATCGAGATSSDSHKPFVLFCTSKASKHVYLLQLYHDATCGAGATSSDTQDSHKLHQPTGQLDDDLNRNGGAAERPAGAQLSLLLALLLVQKVQVLTPEELRARGRRARISRAGGGRRERAG